MPRPLTRPRVAPAPPPPPPQAEGPLREFREYLAASRQHLDQIARAIRDNGSPGVLETATITIPAVGYTERSYRIPYAAVAALNLATTPVTITSASAQNSVPGGGQGMIIVPANSFLAMNMTGQTITFYGASGVQVTYSILVNRIQPSASVS